MAGNRAYYLGWRIKRSIAINYIIIIRVPTIYSCLYDKCLHRNDSRCIVVVLQRIQYCNNNNNNNIGAHAYGIESDGCGTNCCSNRYDINCLFGF